MLSVNWISDTSFYTFLLFFHDDLFNFHFFRQSLCDLFFFALVVDIEMGEDALHL